MDIKKVFSISVLFVLVAILFGTSNVFGTIEKAQPALISNDVRGDCVVGVAIDIPAKKAYCADDSRAFWVDLTAYGPYVKTM